MVSGVAAPYVAAMGYETNGTRRPVMVGIVGDSAAGKTTLTRGIASVFGADRVRTLCVDDYHRYDREERKQVKITPLHPDCNYIGVMEQHLKLLAQGETILKPVYDHTNGSLVRPELVEPRPIVVIEGLLAFHTKAMRDVFDVKVYLDPPEDLRRAWKVQRDCAKRGYEPEEVIASLKDREPDSAAFIRPQREHADIVVRFHPMGPSTDVDPTMLGARLVLRPSLPHPYLLDIAAATRVASQQPVRVSLGRDREGRPIDVLEVEGGLDDDVSATAEEIVWERAGLAAASLDSEAVGRFQADGKQYRSNSLALAQLFLVAQIARAGATTINPLLASERALT